MVRLALENNNWVTLSTWESEQSVWTPTLEVLKNLKSEMVDKYESGNGRLRLLLLCGGDLVETFNMPNVWENEHVSSEFPISIKQKETKKKETKNFLKD